MIWNRFSLLYARAKLEEVEVRKAEGDPARQILDTAKRERADVIAVGDWLGREIQGIPLGSVSNKVARLAECTTITVR